jgi:CBS domain containing-hemolysin-like protein
MKRRMLFGAALPGAAFLAGAWAAELPSPAGLIVPLLVILALVVLNGLYVAAEFAIIGVRRTQLEPLAERGHAGARRVLGILSDPRRQDRYIATAQLGITLASLGLGMYGEPQIAHFIEPYLALALGLPETGALVTAAGYVLGVGALTYLHIVVGEMIPKSLALTEPVKTALRILTPMRLTSAALGWPVHGLNAIGGFLLRLFRVPPAGPHAHLHSTEELEILVDESAAQGMVKPAERDLVHNIFDFGELSVGDVMTPRPQIEALALDTPLPDVLAQAAASAHSRFLVYERDLDNILGALYLRDLLRQQVRGKGQFDLRLLLRPVLAVPEHYPVIKVLTAFRHKRSHLAIVIDEFGGTAGLVTLEDLVEDVMGAVGDEFDQAAALIQRQPDGSVRIDGLTHIDDVNTLLGLDLRDKNYHTIAGLVLGKLGRMARVGDVVETGGVRLKVEALDGLRIARLSLTRTKPDA